VIDSERSVNELLSWSIANYPRVATCAACALYLAGPDEGGAVGLESGTSLIAAVLGHHDSAHRYDVRRVATQHFG